MVEVDTEDADVEGESEVGPQQVQAASVVEEFSDVHTSASDGRRSVSLGNRRV